MISECDASGDDGEIDGPMSFNGSMHEDLFGEEHVHKALESRVVMDPQGDAREDRLAEDSTPELEACSNDSASDKDGDECEAVESECSIVDETVRPSPMKMRTRSKALPNIVVPDSLMCSDPEDDEPPLRQRKRNHTIATPLRAGGTSKYFRRNSNQFPSIASKTLAARKARVCKKGTK